MVGLAPWSALGSTLVLSGFGGGVLLLWEDCAGGPHDLLHRRSGTLGEGVDLALEIFQEGI